MDDLRGALHRVADLIADYREGLPTQHVAPSLGRAALRDALAQELPPGPAPLEAVVDELVAGATPGLMASAGPRYFGFVIGGSPDAALAADLLTVGWDQCAYNEAPSPAALAFEDVAGTWLKELLGLPASHRWASRPVGRQPTPCRGLAAGRWKMLQRVGWDVGRDGLAGAPRVRVVAERRASSARSMSLPPPRAGREGGKFPRSRTVRGHRRAVARPTRAARHADDRLRAGGQREHRSR